MAAQPHETQLLCCAAAGSGSASPSIVPSLCDPCEVPLPLASCCSRPDLPGSIEPSEKSSLKDASGALARSHWSQTSALIVSTVMGTGVLSLPHAAAGLGWVLSITSLVVFAAAATYAGLLLSRVRNNFHPGASSFADLAMATVGPRFAYFTRCAIVSSWFLIMPYFLVAAADALQLIWPHSSWCTWHWTIVVAVLLVPFVQLTTLTAISHLAWLSTIAMVVSMALIIGGFRGSGGRANDGQAVGFGARTSLGPRPGSNWLSLYGHFASFGAHPLRLCLPCKCLRRVDCDFRLCAPSVCILGAEFVPRDAA